MVKRKTAAPSASEDDDRERESEDCVKPARERRKSKQKDKAVKEEQDESGNESPSSSKESSVARIVKKPKLSKEEAIRLNQDGDKYIELGKRKRATVRKFKGSIFVDIREYYETNGAEKPGKKGISLSLEQWTCLKKSQGTIDDVFEDLAK